MAITYADKLKDPRWQRKRLEILHRDEFTCIYCGDKETELQVHHTSYNGEPWQVEDSALETTCVHCHTLIEGVKRYNSELKIITVKKDWYEETDGSKVFQLIVLAVSKCGIRCLLSVEWRPPGNIHFGLAKRLDDLKGIISEFENFKVLS